MATVSEDATMNLRSTQPVAIQTAQTRMLSTLTLLMTMQTQLRLALSVARQGVMSAIQCALNSACAADRTYQQ